MTFQELLNLSAARRPVWDAAGQGQGGGTSETAGNPPAGGTDDGQKGGTDLFAELDEATREWVKTRHEGDVTKLAKQAYELDKFAGKAVQVPGDDANDDDWGKFWSKIGRPEDPTGYEFKVPENLPESLPYDEKLAEGFRSKAHELGLNKKQAASLHDFFVEQQVGRLEEMQGSIASRVQADVDTAKQELADAWGEPGGETWNANLELAARFFDDIDKDGKLYESLSNLGLIGPNKEVLNAPLAFAFANAGAALYQEGATTRGAGASVAGANPFEGDTPNLTQIMALVKQDPDKARTLCKAAGKDPGVFGLN